MSLIQEALKRQQAEGAQAQAAPKPPIPGLAMKAQIPPPTAAPAAPASPPPLPAAAATPIAPASPPPLPAQQQPSTSPGIPPEPPQEQPSQEPELPAAERKALSTLAIVVLVIVLLLMAGISMVYFALTKMKRSAADNAVALLKPAVTRMVPAATQAVPQAAVSAVPSTAQPAGQPAATQQVAAAVVTHVPVASNAPPVIELPPPPKPAVVWPTLKLTAIAGKGLKGAARINGQVVMVGETVEGVTLLEINEQNILLEFKGEKDTLRIGGTTR